MFLKILPALVLMVAAVGLALSALNPRFLESLFGGKGVVPFLAGLTVGAVALIPGIHRLPSGRAPQIAWGFHRGPGRFYHEPSHGGRGHASFRNPVFRPEGGAVAKLFIARRGRRRRPGDVPGVDMKAEKSGRRLKSVLPWVVGASVHFFMGSIPSLARILFWRSRRSHQLGDDPGNGRDPSGDVHPGRAFRSLGAAGGHRALFRTRSRVEGRPLADPSGDGAGRTALWRLSSRAGPCP